MSKSHLFLLIRSGSCGFTKCEDCTLFDIIDGDTCRNHISIEARRRQAYRVYIERYGLSELKMELLEYST